MKRWTLAATLVACALYVLALRDDFYHLTSPTTLAWHVALRKLYSIIAFTVVGYLGRRALIENGRDRVVMPCIAGVALYSALIEVGQYVLGSQEGLGWNAIDTLCGAVGGALAVWDRLRSFTRQPIHVQPPR
ncbi:MAG: hypothetical protein GIX03_00080 [Candidatus Eremiobacteraeota bacterium]|nr:hypothetical protein [Candidatus Eremiobacteraeota bacterium]MBC5801420.1 hypothetical protein [Candidatus Eremiobacteraeota bacterium]MBC5821379.1 hypothetical protein [Candidatus Eremiobacteraeota bacterium]